MDKTKFEENLEGVFGLDPDNTMSEKPVLTGELIEVDDEDHLPTETHVEREIQRDFSTARSNLHSVLEEVQLAISNLSNIADQSQSARDYEVLNQYLKNFADTSKDLLELQSKRKKLTEVDDGSQNVTNNSVFVGSTKELLAMIKKESEKDG